MKIIVTNLLKPKAATERALLFNKLVSRLNLGQVFNSRSGGTHQLRSATKLPNLELKS
jgi:hypothetical protein